MYRHPCSSLCDLPDDVIITIFQYCDIKSLCRLSRTCKKFHEIISSEDSVWKLSSRDVIGSNMSAPAMKKRCKPILSYKQRCRFAKKWLKTYGYMNVLSLHIKCMPWCNLQKDYFFCSIGKVLKQYTRKGNGDADLSSVKEVIPCKDDVSKFAVNENEVVCAGRDGKLTRLEKNSLNFIDSLTAHNTDILAVDSKEDIIITGSKDSIVKIWKTHIATTECKKDILLNNRILSTAIMPSNSSFVVGTPGTNSVHPLQLFDLERAEHIFDFADLYSYGAGVLDIFPETTNTFFSCGYDTNLQLWDVRCPERSVGVWTEPYDSSLYCVQTDYNVTMMTGSSQCGKTFLWDKRVTKIPIKIFYVPEVHSRIRAYYQRGPTYSIAFDASHKYLAFEQTLFEFTFL